MLEKIMSDIRMIQLVILTTNKLAANSTIVLFLNSLAHFVVAMVFGNAI